jgi:hypothetical protein
MAAHCAKRTHSWLYLWTVSHDAPAGHGGKMDHFSIAGDLRFMVVEGAFVAEAVDKSKPKAEGLRPKAKVYFALGFRL